MSLRELMKGSMPVTAPLVLNPLMAKMVEAAGFPAGYLGGGSTGYLKVALEANLNVTEMCQAAVDIRAVSSLLLILDGACGYGDPMHMHRTIGMSEAAGFVAIQNAVISETPPTMRSVPSTTRAVRISTPRRKRNESRRTKIGAEP
jgi:2-methylisocitrate lyase-like PEP mutase family enzyme